MADRLYQGSCSEAPLQWDERLGSRAVRAGVFLFFVLLSIALTFPLVLHLSTRVPGPPWDNMVWLYDLWWFRHSLLDLKQWPVLNPTIFYPFGYDLRLSEIMLPNKVLIAPLLFFGSEILAYNGLLLISFAITGYATFMLLAYLTDNRLAAIIGGTIFAFCPYRMHAMAAGWLPLISTQWIPLTFLYVERMLREKRIAFAALAGLFMALNVLSSWYYLYVVGTFVFVYIAARSWPWRETWRQTVAWRNLAVFVGVMALLVLPIALPVVLVGRGEMGWSLTDVLKWSASLEDFFLPNVYHPLWGGFFLGLRGYTQRYPWYAPGFVYLGLVPLALAVLGATWKQRDHGVTRSCMWMGILSFVLALGVVLHWSNRVVAVPLPPTLERLVARAMSTLMSKWSLHRASYYDIAFPSGTAPIPLPALLVYLFVPLGDALRTLYRFGVMTMFAVTVLANYGVARLLAWRHIQGVSVTSERVLSPAKGLPSKDPSTPSHTTARNKAIGLALVTVIFLFVLGDWVSVPLPYGSVAVERQPLDDWLAGLPRNAVVMQFPLSRAFSGDALYRTRYHGHYTTYGHGTFYPEQYRQAMPVLGSFPSAACLDLLQSWGVTHVVVGSQAYDAGWGDLPAQTWETVQRQVATHSRLHPIGTLEDRPFWRDERISDIVYGNPPVVPLLVDRLYLYELR